MGAGGRSTRERQGSQAPSPAAGARLGVEVHLRRLERVVGREVNLHEEDAARVGRLGGAHDGRLPVEQVLPAGARAAARRRVLLQVLPAQEAGRAPQGEAARRDAGRGSAARAAAGRGAGSARATRACSSLVMRLLRERRGESASQAPARGDSDRGRCASYLAILRLSSLLCRRRTPRQAWASSERGRRQLSDVPVALAAALAACSFCVSDARAVWPL